MKAGICFMRSMFSRSWFSSKNPLLMGDGSIATKLKFGNIIDHKPVTFYSNNKNKQITSSYNVLGKTIQFNLGNYDKNKSITIHGPSLLVIQLIGIVFGKLKPMQLETYTLLEE